MVIKVSCIPAIPQLYFHWQPILTLSAKKVLIFLSPCSMIWVYIFLTSFTPRKMNSFHVKSRIQDKQSSSIFLKLRHFKKKNLRTGQVILESRNNWEQTGKIVKWNTQLKKKLTCYHKSPFHISKLELLLQQWLKKKYNLGRHLPPIVFGQSHSLTLDLSSKLSTMFSPLKYH